MGGKLLKNANFTRLKVIRVSTGDSNIMSMIDNINFHDGEKKRPRQI